MPDWWNNAAPFLHASGVVVALVLGFANLWWLIVQARRTKVTHGIALEAHDWARERRDRESAQALAEEAKRAWWKDTRAAIDASDGPILLQEGIDPAWVTEAEQLGHFRPTRGTYGEARLAKPEPLAAAREQKRIERRGELAEEALLAIRAVCSHVHMWSAMLVIETTQDRGTEAATLEGIRSAVAFGQDLVDPLRGRISALRSRVSVHLESDELKLLSDAGGTARSDTTRRRWVAEECRK